MEKENSQSNEGTLAYFHDFARGFSGQNKGYLGTISSTSPESGIELEDVLELGEPITWHGQVMPHVLSRSDKEHFNIDDCDELKIGKKDITDHLDQSGLGCYVDIVEKCDVDGEDFERELLETYNAINNEYKKTWRDSNRFREDHLLKEFESKYHGVITRAGAVKGEESTSSQYDFVEENGKWWIVENSGKYFLVPRFNAYPSWMARVLYSCFKLKFKDSSNARTQSEIDSIQKPAKLSKRENRWVLKEEGELTIKRKV